MTPRFAWRPLMMATLCVLAAGCASGPRLGGDAWVGVDAVLTARDLSGHSGHSARRNLDAARLRAAGVDDAAVASGRVALVSCSPSVDATWSSFAILPPGLSVQRGQVLRLRVLEDSGNERLGLNTVVGDLRPGLPPGSRLAYRAIPDWRERGLSNNFERVPLPPEHAGRYRIVTCRTRPTRSACSASSPSRRRSSSSWAASSSRWVPWWRCWACCSSTSSPTRT